MIESAAVFGMAGGAVGAIGSVPYLRDTWRRATVPHRGSWFIWGVLELVALASQRADGAHWSLVPLASQALGTWVVVGLALGRGTGGLSRLDVALTAVAGAGIAGWLLVDAPVIATVCAMVADFVAVAMMLPKTRREPNSETLSTFAAASLGGALTAAAVGSVTVPLLVYPVYFFLVNAAVVAVIAYRRSDRSPVPRIVVRPTSRDTSSRLGIPAP
jgi:hypothetical protein